MNDIPLSELLEGCESSTLDFKQEAYWDDKHVLDNKAADLLKDFMAMANNPRGERGYLVLGAETRIGQVHSLHSVPYLDDAIVSQFINSKIDTQVHWKLTFSKVESKLLATLVIDPAIHGPVTLKKDYLDKKKNTHIRHGVIFSRRQSTNAEISPAEYVQQLRIAREKPIETSPPIEETAERWLKILSSHGVETPSILRAFPHFSLADLASPGSVSRVLHGNEMELTSSLFHVNRHWLESGSGPAQRTIDVWSLADYLANEESRSSFVAINWYADINRPIQGKTWHACPVVESHIPELEDIEISRFAPMSRIFWSNESSRLRLFFDVLWVAEELKIPMYWYTVNDSKDLSHLANGEDLTSAVLDRIGSRRQDFHPEDLVNNREEWKISGIPKDFTDEVRKIQRRANISKK